MSARSSRSEWVLLLNLVKALIFTLALACLGAIVGAQTPPWVIWGAVIATIFIALNLADVVEMALIKAFNPEADDAP